MNEPSIPWPRVAGFFRQHTHDVRNDINGIDLEMELLLEELTTDGAKESVALMRKQLRSMEQRLRSLAAQFHEFTPDFLATSATTLMDIWRVQQECVAPGLDVQWDRQVGLEQVSVDEEMMGRVFKELLENAVAFSTGAKVTISGRVKDGEVIFEMIEPQKKPLNPEAWNEPFSSTRHGCYGLGLWTARRMVEANGAVFQQRYDGQSQSLITRIALNVCD